MPRRADPNKRYCAGSYSFAVYAVQGEPAHCQQCFRQVRVRQNGRFQRHPPAAPWVARREERWREYMAVEREIRPQTADSDSVTQ